MSKGIERITRVTDRICYYINYFSMATIVIMMVLITSDVVLKSVFNSPIAGSYEISQVTLSTLIFSSWAYTQTIHGHIHVTMFVSKMPQKLRFFCYGLTALISTATMALATYAVYFQILAKLKSRECTGVLLIPYWPFYVFEMLAWGMLTIVLLIEAVKAIAAIFSKKYADEIQSTWV